MASHTERSVREDNHNAIDLSRAQESHQPSLSVPSSKSQHTQALVQPASAKGIGILVMGLTGVGKSTLISHITQQNVEIGHSLRSCTTTVYGYRYLRTNGQEVWLIDTPGFDDTHKANTQLLGDIASFLCTFCSERGLIIGGMLYIHRITDIRMSNSSIKSLRIFEALCGDACFGDVTIVTTMWDMLRTPDALQSAERREVTLQSRDNFFGRLLKGGARYARHKDTHSSSIGIVEDLVNRQSKVSLALQEELERDSATTLADTTVGRYLEGDLRDMRKKYETKIAQLEAYNSALAEGGEDMNAAVDTEKALMLNIDSNLNLLHSTFEDLRNERGLEMIEDEKVAGSEQAKATTSSDQTLSSDIKSGTKTTDPYFNSHQEARDAESSITTSEFIQNHTESQLREDPLKDKSKKASAWSDFLRAITSSKNPSRVMFFESRRSNSLPSEATEHRLSRANRPVKAVQHREQKVQSNAVEPQYQAQIVPYDDKKTTEPDHSRSEHYTTAGNGVSTRPKQLLFNEIRSSSPNNVITQGQLAVTVAWDQSGLIRNYSNNSVVNSPPPLRHSTLSQAEQIRELYNRYSNFTS